MHRERIDREVVSSNMGNAVLALISAIIIAICLVATMILFDLSVLDWLIIIGSLAVFYAFLIIVIMAITSSRDVERTRFIEKPVIHEIEVEKPVIREVEKPVIREVIREVQKPIIIERKAKKLNIPKYDFLASDETGVFHKRGCRFSKLIKNKYKVSNNHRDFFIRNRYKPCKVCKA